MSVCFKSRFPTDRKNAKNPYTATFLLSPVLNLQKLLGFEKKEMLISKDNEEKFRLNTSLLPSDRSQRGKKGSKGVLSFLSLSHHLKNHSRDSLYSGNDLIAFSTICDLCPKVRSSIFLSIQSLTSLGMVIVNLTRSFFVRDISYRCDHKHINMSDTICDVVIRYITRMTHMNEYGEMNKGDGMNERKEN